MLHAFQKKSRRGIATPEEHIERVKARLRLAEEIDTERARAAREKQGKEEADG